METLKRIGAVLYRSWMAFARTLGVINTSVLLTIVYVLLIGPTSLIIRALRKDLIDKRMSNLPDSFWRKKDPLHHTLEECKHQF